MRIRRDPSHSLLAILEDLVLGRVLICGDAMRVFEVEEIACRLVEDDEGARRFCEWAPVENSAWTKEEIGAGRFSSLLRLAIAVTASVVGLLN